MTCCGLFGRLIVNRGKCENTGKLDDCIEKDMCENLICEYHVLELQDALPNEGRLDLRHCRRCP